MKKNLFKTICIVLCSVLLLNGCGSMNNTTKGGLFGAGGGAALGAIAGALIGGEKGALIGAGVGVAAGTTAGILIGKKMDKAAAAAQAIEDATVETVTDSNGLKAVKVTFDSGILFAVNKSNLNASAKTSLTDFSKVLKTYNDADVAIFGHTDSSGNDAINQPLSENRAKSVADFLKSQGVSSDQIANVEGKGSTMPVADNNTTEGKAQNRRVEIYLYASEEMINAANAGTLQ